MSYFLFTQSARLYYILEKSKYYFDDFNNVVDFGCGPGTAQKIFESIFKKDSIKQKWINIDSSKEALSIAKKWNSTTKFKTEHINSDQIPKAKTDKDLFIASYSLCELKNKKLDNLLSYQNIILLEPGQKKESNDLIELRNNLVAKHGFSVLAPCPNQKECPMTHEKKHWCHDNVEKPKFLNNFDLPFSRDNLNLSYLILSKEVLKKCKNYGRVVGDLRIEKGKTKVAVCHEGELKYLSWLKKTKLNIQINRGELIKWVDDFDRKGQEYRTSKPLQKVFESHFKSDSDTPIF